MIMTMKDKKIEQLIERFLDGRTTNMEEQQLYSYFAGSGISRRMMKYKPMFDWYASGMTEPLPVIKAKRFRMITKFRIAIAASVLLLMGAGFGYYKYVERNELYASYEGSYIIRNGKKITDIKEILPELQRIEREAKEKELRVENINEMSPEEILKMLDNKNKDKDNIPVI